MADTTWSWAHDGTTTNGALEFLADGGVKWDDGKKQGSWRLTHEGEILQTTFNGIYHMLYYTGGKATLITPTRSPPSSMVMKS